MKAYNTKRCKCCDGLFMSKKCLCGNKLVLFYNLWKCKGCLMEKEDCNCKKQQRNIFGL